MSCKRKTIDNETSFDDFLDNNAVKRVRLENGSASEPSLSAYDDPDTGVYFSADGTIDLTINGTNKLSLDATELRTEEPITVGFQSDARQLFLERDGGGGGGEILIEDQASAKGQGSGTDDLTIRNTSGGGNIHLEPFSGGRVYIGGFSNSGQTNVRYLGSDGSSSVVVADWTSRAVGGSAQSYLQLRSANDPAFCDYTFILDTDTGMYQIASGQVGLSCNGTPQLKATSSGIELANGGSSVNYYGEMAANTIEVTTSASGNFFSTSVQLTVNATRIGNMVTVTWNSVSGTNAQADEAWIVGAVDADFRPSNIVTSVTSVTVGAVETLCVTEMGTGGTLVIYNGVYSTAFPGSGIVAFLQGTISYLV
jgi:hypothetical protein